MKNFFVITNRAKKEALAAEKKIVEYLRQKGAAVTVDDTPGDGSMGERYTDIARMPKDTDCVIVLGGDGTILHAACDLAESTVPFLGINLGTLGYLSAVDENNMYEALDKVLSDNYSAEHRMMLCGKTYLGGEFNEEYQALNEIVITADKAMQIAYVSIFVNGKLLHKYAADGIIVSTPTGSTGYNLSAGGPIVSPSADMIILTPVCSHSMHNRSIVFGAEDEIKIVVDDGRFGTVQQLTAVYDASHRCLLSTGDYIKINKSTKSTRLVNITQESFLDTLHNKLKDS